ncbi:MAG: hypothetical protein JSW04_08540 [Desulfobacterales bacterium]|nr:MAG: hypothetical protein JSW04_08540 [Desulfobacterales bacterium]
MASNKSIIGAMAFALFFLLGPASTWAQNSSLDSKPERWIDVLSWHWGEPGLSERVVYTFFVQPSPYSDQAEAIGLHPTTLTLALFGPDGTPLSDPTVAPPTAIIPERGGVGTFSILAECDEEENKCKILVDEQRLPKSVKPLNDRVVVGVEMSCDRNCSTRLWGNRVVLGPHGQTRVEKKVIGPAWKDVAAKYQ